MRSTTSPLFTWLFQHVLRRQATPVLDYVLATVTVVVTGLLRAWLLSATGPWFPFIPVVLVLALTLGRGVGIYATALATVLAGYAVASAEEPYWLSGTEWIASAIFILTTLGMVTLAAELRAAFRMLNSLMDQREADLKATAERESFLASVLASSPDCIKVLSLDGRLTFMTEGGKEVMEVGDFNAIQGCPWPDFWRGAGNSEAKGAVEAAARGEVRHFIGKADTIKGNSRWWHVAVSPIKGKDGRPERILSVSRDITASRRNEEERDRLASIIDHSADFIGMARVDGSVFFLNEAARKLVGLDPEDVSRVKVEDFFPPEQAAEIPTLIFPAVESAGHWAGERLFRHFQTGELIPVLYTVFPVRDKAGTLIGFGTVTRDFRERKRAEEQQQLLNSELAHRLKNVLAIVQAVASQTLRQADDLKSANASLMARLTALGEAAAVLTMTSWSAADLHQLIRYVLAPHGSVGERFWICGPAFTLDPRVAFALALALHELATNAAKYGALSNETGYVDLHWRVEAGTCGGDSRFHLQWREVGGPPVRPPSRRGFGSVMIERSLKAYFQGEIAMNYRPDGFVFVLDAPVTAAGSVSGA